MQRPNEKTKAAEQQTKELKETRAALLNMLEDTEGARRAAEEDRRKTEFIIQSLSDGLLVFDAKNNLKLINPSAERIFLVKKRDVISKSLEDLKRVSFIGELIELLQKEQELFRAELKIGDHAVAEITTSPFQPGGEPPGTMVIVRDITRERAIEAMKTEFISLTAHQLRTPLSAIKWTLRLLLDREAGEISPKQQDLLGKTAVSTERMIRLINDLLDITRIEEGKYLSKPTFKRIEEIVRSMVQSYKGEAARRGLEILLEIKSKDVPEVLVDEEKIRLALQNLLDNAILYTGKGGKVTVRISHDSKDVKVVVQDTGIGIPESQQPRVFEKFFRAENAKKIDTEGSGLGLYLVKNIVVAHGGRIWFESKEGRGTSFFLTLPAKQEMSEFLKKF